MNKLKKFIKKFECEGFVLDKSKIFVIKNSIYYFDDCLKCFKDVFFKECKKEPFAIGDYLGELQGDVFKPSIRLLEMIVIAAKNKLVVDENAEWLFLCGRDLFGKSIINTQVKKGRVLVVNQRDELLGYGKIVGQLSNQNEVVVKNLLDKGDFLRREMSDY